jgi:hypothetical protein
MNRYHVSRIGLFLTLAGLLAIPARGEVPADTSADNEQTLESAIQAIYDRENIQAIRILTAILPEHRENPDYFVAHALSRMITGKGQALPATTSLENAKHLGQDAPETNALLAMCYRKLGKDEETHEHLQLLERHRAEKPVLNLVLAIDHLLQQNWSEARAQLATLAEGEHEYADEAQRRLKPLDAFIKKQTTQLAALETQRQAIDEKMDVLQAALARFLVKQKQVEDEREELKTQYEARMAQVQAIYEAQVAAILAAYESVEDEAEDEGGREGKRDLRRQRNRLIEQAEEKRNRGRKKINADFEPAVKANTKELDAAKKDVEDVQRQQNRLKVDIRKLDRQQQLIERRRPFDIDAFWQDAALWIARESLKRPDLPGPPPAAKKESDEASESDDEAPASQPDEKEKVNTRLRRADETPQTP